MVDNTNIQMQQQQVQQQIQQGQVVDNSVKKSKSHKFVSGCATILVVLIIGIIAALSFGLVSFDQLSNIVNTKKSDDILWDESSSVGEMTDVNGVEWTVTEVKNLGSKINGIESWNEDCISVSGEYVYVKAKIINNTDKTVSLGDIYVIDSQKRQFEDAGSLYECMSEEMGSWEDINPGIEYEFAVAYEIPIGTTGLKLEVTDLNWLFNNKKYIDLGL